MRLAPDPKSASINYMKVHPHVHMPQPIILRQGRPTLPNGYMINHCMVIIMS